MQSDKMSEYSVGLNHVTFSFTAKQREIRIEAGSIESADNAVRNSINRVVCQGSKVRNSRRTPVRFSVTMPVILVVKSLIDRRYVVHIEV